MRPPWCGEREDKCRNCKTWKRVTAKIKRESTSSGCIFDIEGKRQELKRIEEVISDPAFWAKPEESQSVLRKRRQLEETLERAEKHRRCLEDIRACLDLWQEQPDRRIVDLLAHFDIESEFDQLERSLDETETRALLSGPDDVNHAIVTIHPGAGGTESQDWAQVLLRMYLRWAEKHGHETEITDYQVGEEAGIKSVTFLVKGEWAYGLLSAEIGVHRLVRISPFDAAARRHTSFASVFVTPEIEEDVEVVIDEKDLRIDTYRSSGAGGQHVNVTDSAVRITHIPTGIVVQCQNERSQHRNKEMALKILKSKLYEVETEKKRQELARLEKTKADIAWGSQIRSYVLHPYKLAKDHRTKLEKSAVDAVLDGDIDDFISAFLQQKRTAAVQQRE